MNHHMYIAFAILFGIFTSIVESADEEHCYAKKDNPYFAFSTKSPYNELHGNTTRFYEKNLSKCKPIQIWLFTKHGTSFPKKEQIKKMNTMGELRNLIVPRQEKHKAVSLCEDDLLALKNWTPLPEMSTDTASQLSTQGEEDMEQLAKRLKQYLPELLKTSLNISSIYKFKSSNTSRTLASMKSFIKGLFGNESAVTPSPSDDPDYLLKGHETCTSWTKLNFTTMIGLMEQKKFIKSVDFVHLVKTVANRLGFCTCDEGNKYFKSVTAATKTILDIYKLCRAEQSLNISKKSAWCATFTREELQMLEYYDDLYYYYYAGLGRDINKKLGCTPLQDMLASFSQAEKLESSKAPHGVFYFSHDEPLLALLATLGLNKDARKLTWDNYEEMEERKFRTSKMSPFATNLAAVFYNCSSEDSLSYKVSFTLEEKPVVVEGCGKYMCEWTKLKQILKETVAFCATERCSPAPPTTKSPITKSPITKLLTTKSSTTELPATELPATEPPKTDSTGGVSSCNTKNLVILLSSLSFFLLTLRSEF